MCTRMHRQSDGAQIKSPWDMSKSLLTCYHTSLVLSMVPRLSSRSTYSPHSLRLLHRWFGGMVRGDLERGRCERISVRINVTDHS